MPKKIDGKPVDEKKWERAKQIAADSGHAGDYAYITGVYKQMSKARLVIFLEMLKGKALPIGTRKIHGFGTPNAQWVRKGADGKWHYDGMVTPADVKAQEDEEARKKRLTKMKDNMEKKKAENAGKGVGSDDDRPSDAELDKAPKKTQLYWREASPKARELCDLSGVLCMNKEAEDYVESNLDTVFKMTKEQQTEFKKIEGELPLGTDGKWLEDPLFMDEVLNNVKAYRKELDTPAARKRILEFVQKKKNPVGVNAGVIESMTDDELKGAKDAADTWVRLIESHENDKNLFNKLADAEEALAGAKGLNSLPAALITTIAPYQVLNELANKTAQSTGYDTLSPEAKELWTSLGLTKKMFECHATWDVETLSNLIFGMLHPVFGEAYVKPWLEHGAKKWTFVDGSYYSSITSTMPAGKTPSDYEEYTKEAFEKAGAELRKKYAGISKFLEKHVIVGTGGQSNSSPRLQLPRELASHAFMFNPEATWRDIGNELKSLMRAKTVKWDKAHAFYKNSSGAWEDSGVAYLESIINTGRVLGKTPIDKASTGQKVVDILSEYHRAMSPEVQKRINLDVSRIKDEVRTGAKPANATSSTFNPYYDSININPENMRDSYRAPKTREGFIRYILGKKKADTAGRSRWRSSYGTGWTNARHYEQMTFDTNREAIIKNILRGKFYGEVAAVGTTRYTNGVQVKTHAAAALAYAIGTNWQVRALAKKSKVIPDWGWGNLKPHSEQNPVAMGVDVGYGTGYNLDTMAFQQQVSHLRNEKLAEALGMKKKGVRTMPSIVLKGGGDKGREEWLNKIKADWSHGQGYNPDNLVVRNVMEVMYHEYYDKYKQAEKAKGNVQYMYHGTDFQAGASIIKGGMKIGAAKNGRLLGDGIYFAKSSSKSAQYVAGNFSRHGTGVMLQCRVAMGTLSPGRTYRERDETNWDTIYGPKGMDMGGRALQHDEWCVRDVNAIIPIAWVDVALK